MTSPLILRAPPFPWADASISFAEMLEQPAQVDPKSLFESLCAARIGGEFWHPPVDDAQSIRFIVSVQSLEDMEAALALLSADERRDTAWMIASGAAWRKQALKLVEQHGGYAFVNRDPWSLLLRDGVAVIAHGNDLWAALAVIAGRPLRLLSDGTFAHASQTREARDARVVHALASVRYRNPFTGSETSLDAALDIVSQWRTELDANRGIGAACGMAWWKREEIRRFLWTPQREVVFQRHARSAVPAAIRRGGGLAIWPSRVTPALLAQAERASVPIVRVEDGFIRSLGLGVHLVPPSSVVVDRKGIHFDPSAPSDLEDILNSAPMPNRLLTRAKALREKIIASGISKYSVDDGSARSAGMEKRTGNGRLILVPGQVEDDMSVLAGASFTSNLELLRRARALEPDAEIWFRPHPDVDAGHRRGKVDDDAALAYADRIVRGGGMAPLLDQVDAVHTLTSLTGFEALMRGKEAVCHGVPFYAGWGLTRDLGAVPARRQRILTLDELVAGVLILYPRYLDPVTGLPCPPEVLVDRMAAAPQQGSDGLNRLRWVAPLRRWQGRIMAAFR